MLVRSQIEEALAVSWLANDRRRAVLLRFHDLVLARARGMEYVELDAGELEELRGALRKPGASAEELAQVFGRHVEKPWTAGLSSNALVGQLTRVSDPEKFQRLLRRINEHLHHGGRALANRFGESQVQPGEYKPTALPDPTLCPVALSFSAWALGRITRLACLDAHLDEDTLAALDELTPTLR